MGIRDRVLSRVRKLIRHKRTRKYLTASGDWTDDKEQACDFADNAQAGCFENVLGMPEDELEWFYEFETGPGQDFAIGFSKAALRARYGLMRDG